ncbi:MAG: energy-coupling factor transporter transmembrane component T [Eubacteriales bacterium]
MESIKLDPRCKLFLFLSICFLVMNTPNSMFTLLVTTYMTVVAIFVGEWKVVKWKYITLFVALIIEQLLILLPQSAATMFLLIVIVLMKLYIPILISFQIVYKTTTISEFMAAFQKMKLPQTFIIPFAVMFRFIPTVQEEWDGIRHAMGFRGIGIHWKTTLKNPLQTVEYIVVPLLFSCVNVMDELVAASLARGLDSSKKRTCVAKVQLRALDYMVILCMVAFIIYGITL